MKRIFSFDVFDTLLTRKVASPTSLFLIVGERALSAGLIDISAAAFREQRVEAEIKARSSASGQEVTFDEIYQLLTLTLNLPLSAGKALLQLELAVESEMLVPVPGALDLVRKARGKLGGILFVSDMYLPPLYLRGELIKHGFWQDADRLYVSNEWRASKAAGTLFGKILETEKLRPEAIYHTGDRKDADFDVPSRLGVKARHLDVCRLTRYEQMLDQFSVESSGFSSLIAGISRLTRLQMPALTSHLSTLSEIAASLISPVIALYAIWILREAKARNLRRLYFVARDGYLVKKIVDALIKALNLSIETRYLYGSRQAWHLPAITDFSPPALSWLFEKTRTLSLRIVLSRLQILPEQVSDMLANLGWSLETWDTPLDDESLAGLETELLGSVAFREQIEKLVVEKKETVLGYLEQEGLFEPVAWAMVDLGWHGRLQQSLESLLRNKKEIATLGLYFGLYADSPALSHLKTASYLGWDLRCPPKEREIPALVFLMESFCTAPHGSTVGYHRNSGGTTEPECRDTGFDGLEVWGVSSVHSTVEMFAAELAKLSLSKSMVEWDSSEALVSILGTFSKNPLATEARAWGAFPYEDEQGGVVCERLTKSYELSRENLRAAFVFGDERYIPASWSVLWRGAQPHVVSLNNTILKIALQTGRTKKRLGECMRRLLGASS